MIPGINVLNIAFNAIAQKKVQYLKSTSRTQNEVGAWITEYAAPVFLKCSLQPVNSAKYEQLGLDVSKTYHSVWVKIPVTGVVRGSSPDRFIFDGRLLEVEDVKDWHGQDGWNEVLVIDIGPAI